MHDTLLYRVNLVKTNTKKLHNIFKNILRICLCLFICSFSFASLTYRPNCVYVLVVPYWFSKTTATQKRFFLCPEKLIKVQKNKKKNNKPKKKKKKQQHYMTIKRSTTTTKTVKATYIHPYMYLYIYLCMYISMYCILLTHILLI